MPQLSEEECRVALVWLQSAGIAKDNGDGTWSMTTAARASMDKHLKHESRNKALLLTLFEISKGFLDRKSIWRFANVMNVLYFGKPNSRNISRRD